ncbi:MAG: hypothetical protein ACLP5H_14915 [Desulfomonilaceae bacterium]
MAHDSSSIGETALALASIYLSLSLISCTTSQLEELAQETNSPSAASARSLKYLGIKRLLKAAATLFSRRVICGTKH